jgi:acetyl esterase/lipase
MHMGQETQQYDISKKQVLYRMPGMESVTIQPDVAYRLTESGLLTMDIYYPGNRDRETPLPAVVFVLGYPDPGVQAKLGCKAKEMGSYVSWARLAAASGIVGITYTNREPEADVRALLLYIRQNAETLGIDWNRIGLWSCSGNVPLALSLLMQEGGDYLKCAVLCYGFMLDLDGSTSVAESAGQWGFVNPGAGKSVDALPRDVPLFVARAGRDQFPHLNETMDLFLFKALSCNLAISLANHASAPHAFDLWDDSEATREIIRQVLGFLRFHLCGKSSTYHT